MIKLNQILHIQNKVSPETVIVVEGKRDSAALEKIGFKNITTISGKSNSKVLISVLKELKANKSDRIAILTDFDKPGEKRALELSRIFQRNGVKVDSYVRKEFKQKFKIHAVEELNAFTKLMGVINPFDVCDYGKSSSSAIYDKILNKIRFLRKIKLRKQKTYQALK
jgi:5S rRNA maturation endonuclease (ribonuclease M5)